MKFLAFFLLVRKDLGEVFETYWEVVSPQQILV